MDIKARIDALTEAEAKAALEWTLIMCAYDLPCKCCEAFKSCPNLKMNCTGDVACMDKLLNEALKEAQDGHKTAD